ncbi:MAG: hypothetical protein WCS37_08590, partial [Chloroflexota bacterium]
MAGKFFKVEHLSKWVGRLLVIALLLSVNLLSELPSTVEAAPSPPPKPTKKPSDPSANLIFQGMDKIFDPAIGVPGQLLTYTLRLVCDPYREKTLQAHEAMIELQMIGDQQFVKYNSLGTNWTMRDITNNTIYIDRGTLSAGDDETIQLVTTAPSNLNKTIMQQGIYINWVDDYGYHLKGFTLLLPLK